MRKGYAEEKGEEKKKREAKRECNMMAERVMRGDVVSYLIYDVVTPCLSTLIVYHRTSVPVFVDIVCNLSQVIEEEKKVEKGRGEGERAGGTPQILDEHLIKILAWGGTLDVSGREPAARGRVGRLRRGGQAKVTSAITITITITISTIGITIPVTVPTALVLMGLYGLRFDPGRRLYALISTYIHLETSFFFPSFFSFSFLVDIVSEKIKKELVTLD